MDSGGVRPSGTVTFLFTDIVGSTALWEADAEAMRDALVEHDELLGRQVESHSGWMFKHTGDVTGVRNGVSPTLACHAGPGWGLGGL